MLNDRRGRGEIKKQHAWTLDAQETSDGKRPRIENLGSSQVINYNGSFYNLLTLVHIDRPFWLNIQAGGFCMQLVCLHIRLLGKSSIQLRADQDIWWLVYSRYLLGILIIAANKTQHSFQAHDFTIQTPKSKTDLVSRHVFSTSRMTKENIAVRIHTPFIHISGQTRMENYAAYRRRS